MLHVCLLPIVIIAIIAFHFYSLRIPHVNNEISEELDFDLEAEKYMAGDTKGSKVIPFWPGFLSKDFMYISFFMIFFFYLVCFKFEFAMDPINFDPANALKTPAHIYPEWYFLWSYEVLRGFFFDIAGIKAFDIGLAAFGIAQVIFFLLPWLDRSDVVKPAHERPFIFHLVLDIAYRFNCFNSLWKITSNRCKCLGRILCFYSIFTFTYCSFTGYYYYGEKRS
ncbi:hypothetical protein OLX76_02280 [Campylobacter jejuni]|nr:hypothetical protein [Campylobacter jejuni]